MFVTIIYVTKIIIAYSFNYTKNVKFPQKMLRNKHLSILWVTY